MNNIKPQSLLIQLDFVRLPLWRQGCHDALLQRLEQARHWLSVSELERLSAGPMAWVAQQQLASRVLLRAILASRTGLSPQALQFSYGDKGKPALVNHPGLQFNLSHSGHWLLLASCDSDHMQLGADIERLRPKTDVDSIMRHYFAGAELAQLQALGSDDRRQAFFDLWALKESFIKATGLGLAQDLRSFGFELDKRTPMTRADFPELESCLAPYGELDGAEWQSWLGRLDDEYRFALTLHKDGAGECCWQRHFSELADWLPG
ncbi:4'-phosphopantetheinyl transferase family protein [Shewanella cyperi]|uniref:4'-phosphopantetheinyl transferase family protein n=1 Tax=Shewanella cyperi TaxID=2814292 RepID=UPI001D18CCD6|nr:4'-phosphopantetheinyl transferase superfamily protein [Shewanella cyperi]